jgi:hypothetical protein
MRTGYRVVAMTAALILSAWALLSLPRTARAAAQGKITGTVKLEGTPPHMKGIDMSKDPYCVKQHANNPAHLETVVVGEGGGLLSQGLSGAAATEKPSKVLANTCGVYRQFF